MIGTQAAIDMFSRRYLAIAAVILFSAFPARGEIARIDLNSAIDPVTAEFVVRSIEKRAKIIHAEGEFQTSAKLAEAAGVINKEPIALQLRYLQTLTEIGVEKNTTVVFPVPIDIIKGWIESKK